MLGVANHALHLGNHLLGLKWLSEKAAVGGKVEFVQLQLQKSKVRGDRFTCLMPMVASGNITHSHSHARWCEGKLYIQSHGFTPGLGAGSRSGLFEEGLHRLECTVGFSALLFLAAGSHLSSPCSLACISSSGSSFTGVRWKQSSPSRAPNSHWS